MLTFLFYNKSNSNNDNNDKVRTLRDRGSVLLSIDFHYHILLLTHIWNVEKEPKGTSPFFELFNSFRTFKK